MRMSVLKIALALSLISLTGCAHGVKKSTINASADFLSGLEEEIESVEQCCPYTLEVIKDWIAQNEVVE